MKSIRVSLLKLLIGPLLLMNVIGAGLTYWMAWVPARIAFDQSLADTAWALITRIREDGHEIEVDLSNQAEQVLRVDRFDAIYFVVRNASGANLAGDNDFPALQVPHASKEVLIGVAETLSKRQQSQSEILVSLFLLESALALVFIVIVWAGVGRGLQPLQRMQAELNARQHDDLGAVTRQDTPAELIPVVHAINGLLDRVKIGAKAQQDFLGDVAHQLRTRLRVCALIWNGCRNDMQMMRRRHIPLVSCFLPSSDRAHDSQE